MSLHPESLPPIPEETARIARQLYQKTHRYRLLRDELGTIYTDEQFVSLYPSSGQSAASPWRLALVSSPYDPEAHMSIKRSTIWTGYKAHLTETCDDDLPHL